MDGSIAGSGTLVPVGLVEWVEKSGRGRVGGMDEMSLQIERRGDGALLVRVASREHNGRRLPDAVFAFRAGDPQYHFWEERLQEQQPAQH